jgi:succinate dehydrogenase/fumarate reductase flavoprotein subunit
MISQEAAKEAIWLERMGVPFNRNREGRLDLRPFGSNSRSRTCYTDDRTGHIVLQVLHEQCARAEILSFEEWFVTSLVVDGGTCLGVIAVGLRSGRLDAFQARSVVLATGGFTHLFNPSTASIGTTGDGQSLAYACGAQLMDMEMVQFHPTVFPGNRALLITEAALSEGAELTDHQGEPLSGIKGEPRHKICLAMRDAMGNGDPLFLDFHAIGNEKLRARFPQTRELVRLLAGLDVAKDRVPVRPVAHRPMGGIGLCV